MSNTEPNLVTSALSRRISQDGISLEVSIFRLEHETAWTLEVVNSTGTSTVWDDAFVSDEAALAEFRRTLAEEGVEAFSESRKVIPFRRR